MLIEIHCHTEDSQCSSITLAGLIERAQEFNIDALCITDHNRYPDRAALRKLERKYRIKLFPGIEWGHPWGHFLVFGLHAMPKEDYIIMLRDMIHKVERYPDETVPINYIQGLPEFHHTMSTNYFPEATDELISFVHEQGGCIIWAHPFDNSSYLRIYFNRYVADTGSIDFDGFYDFLRKNKSTQKLFKFLERIDAIEIRNGFDNQLGLESYFAERIADSFNLAKVGASDIHTKKMVGSHVMEFDKIIKDISHLVEVIKSKTGYRILNKMEVRNMTRKK